MLTYAIGFIQNVQLVCFAIVFVLMAAHDRTNRSFRWLAYAYVAGTVGAIFQFAEALLPGWISVPFSYVAAPVGYACINAGIVDFLHRGRRTRWVSLALVLGIFPVFAVLSLGRFNAHFEQMDRIATLGDFALAILSAMSAWILLTTIDPETRWPRTVMGTFLGFYSSVEVARVAAYLITGRMPDHVAAWVEVASGMVYVVSCSLLPMNFIWMMNARLHAYMGRQMTTDSLTELLNRRGLAQAGGTEVARYLRDRREFAVALLDLDHFKRLNDTYGHAGGDMVLCETAALLRSLIRQTDMLGRLGGEEFIVLLPATIPGGAATLVENLRTALEHHVFHLGNHKVNVTASFGVAVTANRGGITWDTLVNEADMALYAAKRGGRNQSRFYQPGHGILAPAEAPPEDARVRSTR